MPHQAIAISARPIETGAEIQVPLFVEEGDALRIDRRDDKYMSRVNA
jgi:hypothetical protein